MTRARVLGLRDSPDIPMHDVDVYIPTPGSQRYAIRSGMGRSLQGLLTEHVGKMVLLSPETDSDLTLRHKRSTARHVTRAEGSIGLVVTDDAKFVLHGRERRYFKVEGKALLRKPLSEAPSDLRDAFPSPRNRKRNK